MFAFAFFVALSVTFIEETDAQSLMTLRIRDLKIHWKEKQPPLTGQLNLTICAGIVFPPKPNLMRCEYIRNVTSINNISSIPQIIQLTFSSKVTWPMEDWSLSIITSGSSKEIDVSLNFYSVTSYSAEQYLEHDRLSFYFTFVCNTHQYGPSCPTMCSELDKRLALMKGNVKCDKITGKKTCSEGWMGDLCDIPMCQKKCIYGDCVGPNVCNCTAGWRGSLCDECIPLPGCQHGHCQKAHQCICERHWKGQYCDIGFDYCRQNRGICQHGGTCRSDGEPYSYRCQCSKEYEGKNCETQKSGTCKTLDCGPKGICDDSHIVSPARCRCHPHSFGEKCQYSIIHNEETEGLSAPATVFCFVAIILLFLSLIGYACFKEYLRRENREMLPLYMSEQFHTDNQQELETFTHEARIGSLTPSPSYRAATEPQYLAQLLSKTTAV